MYLLELIQKKAQGPVNSVDGMAAELLRDGNCIPAALWHCAKNPSKAGSVASPLSHGSVVSLVIAHESDRVQVTQLAVAT
jgi:hypothetical protein